MTSFLQFVTGHPHMIADAIEQHLLLSLTAVLLGTLLSIPLAVYISEREKAAHFFLSLASILQTIPTLAFFGLILPIMGIGFKPALFVLFLYSLLPILRNTYTGLKGIDPAYLEAATGMGMDKRQLFFMVKLPLTLPLIMAGIKISTIYIISWATIAAMIGAGGLGDLIFTGIQTYDINYILAGTFPAALLALLAGWLLGWIEVKITPRGLKA